MCCPKCSTQEDSVLIVSDMADLKKHDAYDGEWFFMKDTEVKLEGWIPELVMVSARVGNHPDYDKISPLMSYLKSKGTRVVCLGS